MTYRSLLVPLDSDPLCNARTQFAVRMARTFDAHLSGIASTGVLELPAVTAGAAALSDLAAMAWDELRGRADRAADAFRKECRAAGFEHVDAFVCEGDKYSSLQQHAHCHDLTVLSQPDPSLPGHAALRQLVEQTVLYSPRPTLLLPYAGRFEGRCDTVMVAWDGSREAARAVSDALPLLHKASRIHVVCWRKGGVDEGEAASSQLERVGKWLGHHGIRAETHSAASSGRIAEAMLSQASELAADFIVMGAYGHARWAQRIMGGATRGLLEAMTVPVLMSH